MEQYAIKGGNPLVGEVEIGGAKNSALGPRHSRGFSSGSAVKNLPATQELQETQF